MKAFTILALALVAAVGCAEETHIELRVHKSPSKLYITPLGKQCAYNASIDPSMYPCRDGGVCVRKNETYGVCELPSSGSDSDSSDDSSESDDSNSDSSDDSDDSNSDSSDDSTSDDNYSA